MPIECKEVRNMSKKKKRRRKLTPLGKITVVLLLSSLVFLILTVRNHIGEQEVQEESQEQIQLKNEELYRMAQDVYDEIINDSMTQMQKAYAIYDWARTNIHYSGDEPITTWEDAAFYAFKYGEGDCYNFFSATKILLKMAGIDNIDVVKSDRSQSSHFWSLINLGDGWYHFDCTPRSTGGHFFMLTDVELEAYSLANGNSHVFAHDRYPERATQSVQHLVDYEAGIIYQ